jgi:hypothetical protein
MTVHVKTGKFGGLIGWCTRCKSMISGASLPVWLWENTHDSVEHWEEDHPTVDTADDA